MGRWLRIAALLALSVVLGGSRCGEDEGALLEELRQDVAPPFAYSLYCDARGQLNGGNADVLLVHRTEHLERVYADAQRGEARARALMGQLESQVQASGAVLADQALGFVCTSLPTCTVRWAFLDELIPSHAAGGMRLRQVLATSFTQAAREKQVTQAVISAALSVLLVGMVVEKAEVTAAGAEARALAAGAARLTEGLSLEEAAALEGRLAEAETLESGARYSAKLEELARHRPSLNQPPSGISADYGRWVDYVAYWERRYEELSGARPLPPGTPAVKPPLVWDSYNSFLGQFQRALEFQRTVARTLRWDAGLAKGERQWLRGLEQPLVAENVGLAHGSEATLTYVDQLVVDTESLRPGQTPNVQSFSNKRRNLSAMTNKEIMKQLRVDAQEARMKYGGTVEIRRPGHPLFGRKVEISRVHLIYEDTGLAPELQRTLERQTQPLKIELHFHAQK